MPSDLELALELQRMDRILRELETGIRSLPKRIAEFDQRAHAAKLHAEGAAAEARAAAESAEASVATGKAEATRASEEDRKKGVKLFKERNALHASLPKPLRDTYDRIRKSHKDGLVVADCTDAVCTGCLMTIRPALMQQIRSDRAKLFFCESCRRILAYNPPQVVAG
jgi:hypothetical protein